VDVLEKDHRGPIPGDPGKDLRDVEDQQPPPAPGVSSGRIAVVETVRQGLAMRHERLGSEHRPAEVDEDGRGHLHVARVGPAADGPEPLSRGSPTDRAEQARFANSRVAGEEKEAPVTSGDLADSPIAKVKQIVPPDENRTDECSRALHEASLRGIGLSNRSDDR
jgi:hypothetical protein